MQGAFQARTRALFSANTQADGNDEAAIIGSRRNGGWRFYARTITGSARLQQMNDSVGDSHFCVRRIGGPDAMLIRMLSGCSFGVGNPSAGGHPCSQRQPPNLHSGTQGMDPTQRDSLVQGGLEAGTWALLSLNTQAAYTDKAAIIGIRRNRDWLFYAQTITGAGRLA